MGIFSTIYLIVSILFIIFLAFRCIVLTKALNTYVDLMCNLINDTTTANDIKIIASAMYGISVTEFERRMKNGN